VSKKTAKRLKATAAAAAAAAAGIRLAPSERTALYGARRFINSSLEEKLRLRIPFDIYFQDPLVAAANPKLAFDQDCPVPWEPGLSDGPTSARFAVVDYDGHLETLTPPARWDPDASAFVDPQGTRLDRRNTGVPQFHQVNVWAIVQRALDFFESGFGLGRAIAWGFEGNRLIVVPHAGPGENAYYDRESKSLQFYYFDRGGERIYTCLSTDIVNHEFGHAILDGIRPHYIEAVLPETAAFHEFIGDLTAVLLIFRNNEFRRQLIAETGGDLTRDSTLSGIAEQFGEQVEDKPYLRSALNKLTMKKVAGDQRPHYMSQVLTGAMFDILLQLLRHYGEDRKRTVAQKFADTIQRMQNMAIQPLDLLPPVDVTFADYALAVLRAEEIVNPTDPDDYRRMMLDVFIKRGILPASLRAGLTTRRQLFDRLDLDVFHDIDEISTSRANAYRFLDDNRRRLFIPRNVDVVVSGLATAQKLTREARRQPRQVLLQYIWREDVVLEGPRFGRFDGAATSLLCGGTLVLYETGDVVAWARKPGSQPLGDTAKPSENALAEQATGAARRAAFLEALERRIRTGRIGTTIGGERGLLAKSIPPLTARTVNGLVRFELSPHFGIHDDRDDIGGGRAWQISS
jgi:hypothetical protein